MEWKGSTCLRYVLNRVHNLAPHGSKWHPCPSVNSTMTLQLIGHLDLEDPLDAAVVACATMAFWGQCCLGKLFPLSSSNLLSTSFPVCSGFKRSECNPLSCVIHLPHTKTHRHGQDIVLVDQCSAINLISLLKRHLHINNIPNNSHLFSYASTKGLSSLTKSRFLHRCNGTWIL
jgi:hypothetical protein